ncbi:MAG: hypothetical protein RLZZ123_93 [Pseudomonadota bacterium]|jgi:hypothetical protein
MRLFNGFEIFELSLLTEMGIMPYISMFQPSPCKTPQHPPP